MDKLQTFWIEIIFVVTIVLSFLSGNKTMSISATVILLLRLIHADKVLDIFASRGINIAILLLTISVLAPLALNRYNFGQLRDVVMTPAGWIAIGAGILVTLLGTTGVAISSTDITILLGVTLGSVLGVALFHGTPMGPLIGSGIAYCVLVVLRSIFKF